MPTPRPFITPDEQDELDARRPVHAGMLPTNIASHVYVTGSMYNAQGGAYSPEEDMRGWTAQQPFTHVECYVLHTCIYCAENLDPNLLRQHECAVRRELEHAR